MNYIVMKYNSQWRPHVSTSDHQLLSGVVVGGEVWCSPHHPTGGTRHTVCLTPHNTQHNLLSMHKDDLKSIGGLHLGVSVLNLPSKKTNIDSEMIFAW